MEREIIFADLERAARDRDPNLANLVCQFLEQDDPPPGRSEISLLPAGDESPDQLGSSFGDADDYCEDSDDSGDEADLPADAWTIDRLRLAVSDDVLCGKAGSERKAARKEAWESLLASINPPPRLRLGKLLIDIYESGDEPGKAALIDIFRSAKLCWGIWQAFKRVYKLAEDRHDAAMFGVLAWRIDGLFATNLEASEISFGTRLYLRRRAWRYLRLLGSAIPEVYPQFAVEVLRNYDHNQSFYSSWVASQIWGHKALVGAKSGSVYQPRDLKQRAFPEAWKLSPAPALRLLEDARNDSVSKFAIGCLKEDFPAVLASPDPSWLARLGAKSCESVHDFVVEILKTSSSLHQSKLRELGLHKTVISFLTSSSDAARGYALEYARSHAPDLSATQLVALADEGEKDVVSFAISRLTSMQPSEIGLRLLCKMVGIDGTRKLAEGKIREGYKSSEIDKETFLSMAAGEAEQLKFIVEFYASSGEKIPAGYWAATLANSDCSWDARRQALKDLAKRKADEIGVDWLKKMAVDDKLGSTVAEWLKAGMIQAGVLDVDWVKSLIDRPKTRTLALALLENRNLVAPAKIGVDWLLRLARSSDEALHKFAHQHLLEHFAPADFAPLGAPVTTEEGLKGLWALAVADQEPARAFAALYLKAHHPDLNATLAEVRALGAIKPRLSHEDFPLERVRPLIFDKRPDVRRLGTAIAAEEIERWHDLSLLYEMAASSYREPRNQGCELLLGINLESADKATSKLPASWLVPANLFALAESQHKASRETALTIIRRAYGQVGGAEKLAWLMESPDRDVRLFAVRLFWDRHRPRQAPATWKPGRAAPASQPVHVQAAPFADLGALQLFARTVLFGLPPGRMERRDSPGGDRLPERPLAASIAKRRLIDSISALAVEDSEFARAIAPVLEEFVESLAKTEWQGCVAALAKMRSAHPELGQLGLPLPTKSKSKCA